jgi:phosphoenolpyruvate carboxylase
MVVFKTDWEVAGLYAGLAVEAGADRWLPQMREECERCRDALLGIRGGRDLLDHQVGLRDRLIARGEALRPLHELQVSLLARWRRDRDDAVLRLVHGTINGIAAGVQNTG